jgi:hypothetical protein
MVAVIYNKKTVTQNIRWQGLEETQKAENEAIQAFEQTIKEAGADMAVASALYSVQYDVLKDIEDDSIVILHNVGVRYDSARETIAEKHLTVYRADTFDELLKAIAAPASATLADLNEN